MGHRVAVEGHRVLVSAPYGRDAESVAALLVADGYQATVCRNLINVVDQVSDDIGVILLTEEALIDDVAVLKDA